MADVIRLLPDSVANQIAAGEVIQNPASVLKELVENAVDAGATDIAITITDAGRTLLQVADNGKGMSATDARLAFERHATSKIRSANDLFTLNTMGFRGEALPSICAIAQVELHTCQQEEEMGSKLIIAGSKVETQEPCYCNRGTTISVKNIFFNVPARRRFLKSDNVELARLMREFERLALVNNNVRFRLDTGTRKRELRPGSFKQRIADLWKGNLNIELLPVEIDTDIVKIKGYISRPEHARRRNPLQYLIVNGRNMRHPYFSRAIINCYDKLIAPDTQPNFFLKFEVDPATIDVNIHPTKNEIKFENEQNIWSLLTSAVRAALGKFSAVPSIDFETGVIDINPLRDDRQVENPGAVTHSDYNPFAQRTDGYVPGENIRTRFESSRDGISQKRHSADNWDSLYVDFMHQAAVQEKADKPEEAPILPLGEQESTSPLSPMCIQVDRRYIVTSTGAGVMIIDQYRAHVKILYEELMQRIPDRKMPLQGVMFGDELRLDATQAATLAEVSAELHDMGITLMQQGDLWVITTLPPMLSGRDGRDIVLQILDSVNADTTEYGKATTDRATLKARMALTLARNAAIERGRVLSAEEMEHIISLLFRLPSPATGPDGKPVICLIDSGRLENYFK